MTDTQFRRLLFAYIAATIASIVAMFFPDYSTELAQTYANEPSSWFIQIPVLPWVLLGVAALVNIASLIGLFHFKVLARSLALYSSVVGLVFLVVGGPSLISGLEQALSEIASVLWGVILALAYYSPISTKFNS